MEQLDTALQNLTAQVDAMPQDSLTAQLRTALDKVNEARSQEVYAQRVRLNRFIDALLKRDVDTALEALEPEVVLAEENEKLFEEDIARQVLIWLFSSGAMKFNLRFPHATSSPTSVTDILQAYVTRYGTP